MANRRAMQRALEETGGNARAAARLLDQSDDVQQGSPTSGGRLKHGSFDRRTRREVATAFTAAGV